MNLDPLNLDRDLWNQSLHCDEIREFDLDLQPSERAELVNPYFDEEFKRIYENDQEQEDTTSTTRTRHKGRIILDMTKQEALKLLHKAFNCDENVFSCQEYENSHGRQGEEHSNSEEALLKHYKGSLEQMVKTFKKNLEGRADSLTTNLFRRTKKESNYFLEKNGSTAARKSMVFSKFFLSWVKNYINNLCKFHHIESPYERKYLFFYHIVLSYPKEKVLAVLNFFFGDQPEELNKYQNLLEGTKVQSKKAIHDYYTLNSYFKRILDNFKSNLDKFGEDLVGCQTLIAKMLETYCKISGEVKHEIL
ncbi:unnamed protein product [Moneuplotes crassus]|uniref:Uncharacterized protein n=1 Tax=Euplotes crassus TaxID=5936 RepID=A0AAD1UKH7_EUPCR|nr:unnamed protein product [Moneuplotes crassus]